MRFGLAGCNGGLGARPDVALRIARLGEELGYDSLWTVEHVVVPSGYESVYPYASSGKLPGGEDVDITDPLVWMAFVASATERVLLGTGILILPQRNPVVLAKEIATLDLLSGGRVLLGIGVGWLREEFDAIGVPFEDRTARAEEYVEAMRVLWREDEPTFKGRFCGFERARCNPKPARPGGPPVLVGGSTDPAARRAGRIGDGYFPWRVTPDELENLLAAMRESAKDAGRDPDAIEVTIGGTRDLELIPRYEELGASRFLIPAVGRTADEIEAVLRGFAERFM